MFVRIAALALWACVVALPVSAADYPDHPIKMVVPFAAGGGTDVLARIIAQNLNSKWGQPVVVENQPGASGAIGTRAMMKAAPDGYTLLMASTGALMAVSAGAGGDGPFDVNKYLTPIVIGAAPPYLLVASPTLPIKTTADLIRYAKERPEGLTFGSSGVGAASHLSGLLFASETGIKLLHIPYKGTGPAVTDLLGGRIDIMFAPGPVVAAVRRIGPVQGAGRHRHAAIEILSRCPNRRRRRARLRIGRLVRPAGAAEHTARDRQEDQRGHCGGYERPRIPRPSGDAGRRAQAADAGRVRAATSTPTLPNGASS